MLRIFLVEDDEAIARNLIRLLSAEGFNVTHALTRGEAHQILAGSQFDLALVDISLPDGNGFAVCTEIKENEDIPVIFLTASDDEASVVTGFHMGADDYVTKPFRSKELLARVSTRLRRTNPGAAEHVRAGDLDIDVAGHQVKRGESVISLTPLEFELLVTLARSPWKVFTREELLSQVWGYQHPADTRLVNVHVQRLRAKIEKDPERPSIVVTVRGVGYRVGESA